MMKLSRKLQLYLADKSPAFDRPSVYRRPMELTAKPKLGFVDMVGLLLFSLVVGIIGLLAIGIGAFVLIAIFG
jgi:hypothetical protein